VADGDGWTLDARRCISYLTIELRGSIPEGLRSGIGSHVFGCDICQDVCPWNGRAPQTEDPAFAARPWPDLGALASMPPEAFRDQFGATPVERAKHTGLLRNACVAMGNSGEARFRDPLTRLTEDPDPLVAEHAGWGLRQLDSADRTGP
jgi:epoxyqueuosine reductase